MMRKVTRVLMANDETFDSLLLLHIIETSDKLDARGLANKGEELLERCAICICN
jgi:hypothetical protein